MRRYSNEDSKRKASPESSDSRSDKDSEHKQEEEKKEIFVKNLSFNTKEDECKEFFEKFGKINRINILQRDGRSKGMGFIEFANTEDAEKLIKSGKELELDGRSLSINWANEKKTGGDSGASDAKTKTIFVGNLSFKATENSIEEFFGDCGRVVGVRIAKMNDGKSKGFCHVDFEDEESVDNALKKNGEDFEGRNIRVDKTLPRGSGGDRRGGFNRDRGSRGGRGGFSRGGRGGYHDRDRGGRNDRDRDSYRRNDRDRRDRSRD